jgi:hypothetical protein
MPDRVHWHIQSSSRGSFPCIFGTSDITSISKFELEASAAISVKQPSAAADLPFGHHAEEATMFDESMRLRENPRLFALLSHYAQQGTEDRATWRDRVMQMEGIEPKELSKLHGELIAFDWIEQNSGQAYSVKQGTLSACYRVTLLGLREYCRFQGVEIEEEYSRTLEKSQPRFPRKRKEKSDSPEALAVAASE